MKSFLWIAAVTLCVLTARAGELQDAAAGGEIEKVRALIKANPAAINNRDGGTTALHEAARGGHFDIVKLLVASGAKVNEKNFSGLTPLKLALGYRRTEIAEYLRKNGGLEQAAPPTQVATPSQPTQPTQPPAQLFTPTAPAAQPPVTQPPASQPPIVVQKAPTAPPMQSPATPAARVPNTVEPTTETPFTPPPQLTESEILSGTFPIHELARAGDVEQIKMLYKNIPEIVDATDERGLTALHVAAANKQLAAAQTLIGLRAKVNARAVNGQTPLHIAARSGDVAMLTLLLTNRAAVDARDSYGQTPLMMVLQSASAVALDKAGESSAQGTRDMKEALARARADVLARNEGVVNLLLKAGADPNATDSMTGKNTLHYAAALGHAPLVEALLRYRARVDATDSRGETPLGYALRQDQPAVVKVLRAAGGSPGRMRTLSATEQSLADFYQRTELALQQATGSEKARLLIALNPTEADCKRMFPKHATVAWKVVEQVNKQIREAFARSLPDAEQGKEIWRVSPELPSAIVQDWRARGMLASDLPAFSLTVEKVGATTRPGDYIQVNGHWVMMPPLRNIAAQVAAAETGRR
jgi:ankyrin repeat protein